MARSTKKDADKQRNAAASVYLTPELKRWIDEQVAETGDSLSSILRRAVHEYAKEKGFDEDAYKLQTKTNDENESENDEASLIARQLSDLALTIERMMKNGTKHCFAM